MTVGTRLGPYKILQPLGAGGMGEVYRADDPRLARQVAIKVLSRAFTADTTRLRRFEQEAKTLAALNHPNILAIYDSGVQDGTPYLVSELLEGRTLREELTGVLPVRKVLEYGLQLARGLAAAHSSGVVHRDLKPENIFITKGGLVKILDFGLAKLRWAAEGPAASPGHSPAVSALDDQATIPDADALTACQGGSSAGQTQTGMVMGTPGYMSPEQVRGEQADSRSDIFAFGAILYEMLSGQRAFRRATTVQTMNAILTEEPAELAARTPNLPAPLERLVNRCLEKSPGQRFQSASDLAFALENLSGSGSAMTPALRQRQDQRLVWARLLPWSIAALSLVALALLGWFWPKPTPLPSVPHPVRKFEIFLPRSTRKSALPGITDVVVSPDGSKLAYSNGDGIWLRWLDRAGPPSLLVASEKARLPFWSPTSAEIGYFEETKLKRVPITGGRPTLICRTEGDTFAGAWLNKDQVYFCSRDVGRGANGIYQTSATGGDAKLALATGPDELLFFDVSALPGDCGALYAIRRQSAGDAIALFSGTNYHRVLLELSGSSLARPVYSSTGHILYERRGETRGLWAFAFSLTKLERTGEPFRVCEEAFLHSVAEDGTLVYHPTGALMPRQLVWVDRTGHITETIGPPLRALRSPRLSPDEHWAAAVSGETVGSSSIYICDLGRATLTPISQGAYFDHSPFWFPDNRRVLFTRTSQGSARVFSKVVQAATPEEELFKGAAVDLSRNGELLLLGVLGSNNPPRLMHLNGAKPRMLLLPVEFAKFSELKLSPDGKLLAYVSEQTGRPEVFIVALPELTDKTLISREGGMQVQWRPDGSELFYVSRDGRSLLSVPVKTDRGLELGAPTILFDFPEAVVPRDTTRNAYDVAPGGQRFLMMRHAREDGATPALAPSAVLVQNWFEEFRQRP